MINGERVAAGGAHEFVVAPEVAKRLGVLLHAGDRVRFEVIAVRGTDTADDAG